MLRQAAEEGATFIGTLVDVLERAETVTIRMATGRAYRGLLRAVGRDFVVIREPATPPALLAIRAVTSVRTVRGGRFDSAGDRKPTLDTTLASVLAGAAADRPAVQVGVPGEPSLLLGELRAAGTDVVTLRLDAATRPTIFVPVSAVDEVVLLDLV